MECKCREARSRCREVKGVLWEDVLGKNQNARGGRDLKDSSYTSSGVEGQDRNNGSVLTPSAVPGQSG